MFTIGVVFFGSYALLQWVDELVYHRRRGLGVHEWTMRLLTTLLVTTALGYALFIEYTTISSFGFGLLVAATILSLPLAERDAKAIVSGDERALHTVVAMMHPLMLFYLGATWRFIDGAGFFLKIILPFSTKSLRPLCRGYFTAMIVLFVFQAIYWPLEFRRRRALARPAFDTETQPVALAAAPAVPAPFGEESSLVPVSENESDKKTA